MHKIQERLLEAIELQSLNGLTLREIGDLINEGSPQKIKHHLEQLEKRGLVLIDKHSRTISKVSGGRDRRTGIAQIPILGAASCGPAEQVADQYIEGYLSISSRILPKIKGLFAIRAVGHSMNRANVDGENIEDGDYVLIDGDDRAPGDGDYVLSVIGGVANIKKIKIDKKRKHIILMAESSGDFPPIYLDPKDISDYIINGKVVKVIKKPRM
jgi:SOS-response transcriptional repressor LexA